MKHPITLLLELCAWLAGLLPESLIALLSSWTAWWWWHVLRYRRRVILENLARAFPESSERERRRLGRAATTHLVRTLLEFLRIPALVRRGFGDSVRFEGLDHFFAARGQGKGVLCVSGHLGSFELAVAGVAQAAKPISLVVKPFPRAVDAFMSRVRRASGLELISAENALKPIFSALKRNEAVVFVLDQNATRSIGVFVDFFGTSACTMAGLATIAVRTGAPVIAAVPYRDEHGVHVLRVLPAIPLEERATRDETILHMTQVYTRVIEDAIRAHPEQWFWTHKRWRTRPQQ